MGAAESLKPKFDSRLKQEGMERSGAAGKGCHLTIERRERERFKGNHQRGEGRRVSDPEDKAAGTGSFGWELISLCTCLSLKNTLHESLR